MGSRTPPIPMANPFEGSFEVESNGDAVTYPSVLQYHVVKKGGTDELIMPLAAADCPEPATVPGPRGFNIEGIAQFDALIGEWVGVRYFGVTWAWASENISRDAPIDAVSTAAAATNGRMRQIDVGTVIAAGQMIAGIALENGAEDELFKVFLTRQVQVALA